MESQLTLWKEIFQKSQDTYNLLDEWNIKRFHSEMEGIRDLVNVIREAIEIEIQIPNEIVLQGNRFVVDLKTLTIEPFADVQALPSVEKIRI